MRLGLVDGIPPSFMLQLVRLQPNFFHFERRDEGKPGRIYDATICFLTFH